MLSDLGDEEKREVLSVVSYPEVLHAGVLVYTLNGSLRNLFLTTKAAPSTSPVTWVVGRGIRKHVVEFVTSCSFLDTVESIRRGADRDHVCLCGDSLDSDASKKADLCVLNAVGEIKGHCEAGLS